MATRARIVRHGLAVLMSRYAAIEAVTFVITGRGLGEFWVIVIRRDSGGGARNLKGKVHCEKAEEGAELEASKMGG